MKAHIKIETLGSAPDVHKLSVLQPYTHTDTLSPLALLILCSPIQLFGLLLLHKLIIGVLSITLPCTISFIAQSLYRLSHVHKHTHHLALFNSLSKVGVKDSLYIFSLAPCTFLLEGSSSDSL